GVLNTGAALPWTLTLVGRWFPIEQRTKNLAGKEIGLDDLVKELLAEPFLSPARGRFDEYDYQGIYALAVVTSRGVAQYEPEARKRMRAALDHWEKIDAESNGGPDAAGEAAGRVKINGILLGALFRGKPDLFPVTEFGADAQRLVEHLARDHQQYLMPLGADQSGILTSIPIAIHGLDLAEKALQPN
ncbi:hypothetical protein HYR69_11580, partial [Candidatus Sumerlaeota bacterium]|nr:hypothetical protein [Candidatus Sumerlaeota bacterium]